MQDYFYQDKQLDVTSRMTYLHHCWCGLKWFARRIYVHAKHISCTWNSWNSASGITRPGGARIGNVCHLSGHSFCYITHDVFLVTQQVHTTLLMAAVEKHIEVREKNQVKIRIHTSCLKCVFSNPHSQGWTNFSHIISLSKGCER